MEELKNFHQRLRDFEANINARKVLKVHQNNQFNKQFGILLKDFKHLEIIVGRIESTNSNDAITLSLDLKSLYVFGRVFVESLLFIGSLFTESSKKIDWTKIGKFIDTVEQNIASETDSLKNFWRVNEKSIRHLNLAFKYRNYVLHTKESTTEWTFAWPGRSNLDHVFITNVPWPESQDKEETKSLNARNLVDILTGRTSLILDYLESI